MRDGTAHHSDVDVGSTDNHEGHQVDHDDPPFSPLVLADLGELVKIPPKENGSLQSGPFVLF